MDSHYKTDRTLWIAIFALVASGLVMVYSTSFIFALERYRDGLFFFKRHLIFIVLGIASFTLGWRIKVQNLKKVTLPFLGFVILALVATLIPALSHRAGGASRWLSILGFVFQPSELAKFAVILYVATQLDRKLGNQTNWRSGFLTYFVGAVPIYILLLLQPDFGSTALMLSTTFFMLLACGVKVRYLLSTVLLFVPTAVALIVSSPYRKDRFIGFLDPWSDPANKGFQVIQSFLAFFSGKWFGVGLGNSREKLFYLPEAHNDFIFSVIGEELGLFGVLFFVGLFLVVILRGLTAAQALTQPFTKGLAVGISTVVGLQAFFNMGVALGLLPTKGLPLPLISYGGTSLVMTLFMLGMLAQLSEKTKTSGELL